MSMIEAKKKLRGRDIEELQRRVVTLRHALALRQGTVLSIEWATPKASSLPSALVSYQVPLPRQRLARAASPREHAVGE